MQGEASAEPGRGHLVPGTVWAKVWGWEASSGAFISGFPDQDLVGGHGVGHAHPAAAVCLPLPGPHLHQPHHLQVRWVRALPACQPRGALGPAGAAGGASPLPPTCSTCVGPAVHRPSPHPSSARWALPLLASALHTGPEIPCACSEETPPRTGPEGLQELDSLDTEKGLLCSPGSG